jgi:hypothetical protein
MGHTPEHRNTALTYNIRFLPLPLRYVPLVTLLNRTIGEILGEGLGFEYYGKKTPKKPSLSEVSLGGMHVLVAEDNSMMANVCERRREEEGRREQAERLRVRDGKDGAGKGGRDRTSSRS